MQLLKETFLNVILESMHLGRLRWVFLLLSRTSSEVRFLLIGRFYGDYSPTGFLFRIPFCADVDDVDKT